MHHMAESLTLDTGFLEPALEAGLTEALEAGLADAFEAGLAAALDAGLEAALDAGLVCKCSTSGTAPNANKILELTESQ
jgi:hypothetical protein